METSKLAAAITFDDGPHAEWTPRLLDILKTKNVQATFFVVGERAARNPDLIRRMALEGHEVQNHTWTHRALPSLSSDEVREEICKTSIFIENLIGRKVTQFRPPYGLMTQSQRAAARQDFGCHIVFWSVDPRDWTLPGTATVTRRVLKGIHPGAIILLHDIHPDTIRAVPEILDGIRAKGYLLMTVSNLLAAG